MIRCYVLIKRIFLITILLIFLHFFRRIFLAERFIIPSDSMQPTLTPGDIVWVNKLLFGARIYTSFDFSEGSSLDCVRIRGLRKIKTGDVICFNYPLGYDKWTVIQFKINYVYCKRVIGVPGDTIGIKDGVYWNNNYDGSIGYLYNQLEIQNMPDSVLMRQFFFKTMPFTKPIWNMKNFGPLYIPQNGATIALDSLSRAIYGPIIQYEEGKWPPDDTYSYTFKQNYYFGCGDNCLFSVDSRYWGFIPEDFIIGIVAGKKVHNNPNQFKTAYNINRDRSVILP